MSGPAFVVREYRHCHLLVGVAGNVVCVIGSILFSCTYAVWHTVAASPIDIGSAQMLPVSFSETAKAMYEKRERDDGQR